MNRPSASAKRWFTLLALLVVGFIGLAQWDYWLPGTDLLPHPSANPPVRDAGKSNRPLPIPEAKGPKAGTKERQEAGTWQELQDCTLVEERSNDGDSFEVRHGGAVHTLRLYFADCPEKTRHQYNGPRLAEQGQYFDGLTEEETVAVGASAREFSLRLLRAAPFRVLTRWEPVFESGRFFAFVTVEAGDLAEMLVKEGLARVHTKGENRPGGKTVRAAKKHLLDLERQAKISKRGAWGMR